MFGDRCIDCYSLTAYWLSFSWSAGLHYDWVCSAFLELWEKSSTQTDGKWSIRDYASWSADGNFFWETLFISDFRLVLNLVDLSCLLFVWTYALVSVCVVMQCSTCITGCWWSYWICHSSWSLLCMELMVYCLVDSYHEVVNCNFY